MATRYIGSAATGPQFKNDDVVGAASGGTLAGSQKVQVVFDDSVFGSSLEGKQRLLNALKHIEARIEAAKIWPITSSS